VNHPKLILADEPTAALDKETGRDVVALFQRLASEEGTAVLIVTHDNRILDVADRILNMVDGRIVSDVAVEESIRICQFLSRCPVFSELTPAALSDVGESMTTEQYPSSSIIIRQGDPGDKFYLVKEGEVEVIVDDGVSRRVVATLGEGEFFGEAALITGEPRNATVASTHPVQLYALGKDDFENALGASASFREQLLAVFFQRQQ
jgi:putative ABC transport system ATP-binding protein